MVQNITQSLKNLISLYGDDEAFSSIQWLLEERLNKKVRTLSEVKEVFHHLPTQHPLWNDVDALQSGKPMQHILGKAYFLDLEVEVNEHTLIPRPETEELVDYARMLFPKDAVISILDVGTGSGCIPIALAQYFNNATVQAIDISKQALQVAQRNAKKYMANVLFTNMDALVEMPTFKMDLLISNPPYIAPSEKAMMHKNVLNFEPELALFVPEENPLLFYKRLKAIADAQLKEKGCVLLEINPLYAEDTLALFFKEYTAILIKDMQGKQRFVKAIKE